MRNLWIESNSCKLRLRIGHYLQHLGIEATTTHSSRRALFKKVRSEGQSRHSVTSLKAHIYKLYVCLEVSEWILSGFLHALFDALVTQRLFVLSSYPGNLSSLEHKAGRSLYLSYLSPTSLQKLGLSRKKQIAVSPSTLSFCSHIMSEASFIIPIKLFPT